MGEVKVRNVRFDKIATVFFTLYTNNYEWYNLKPVYDALLDQCLSPSPLSEKELIYVHTH
jgi:hypothetical protein